MERNEHYRNKKKKFLNISVIILQQEILHEIEQSITFTTVEILGINLI